MALSSKQTKSAPVKAPAKAAAKAPAKAKAASKGKEPAKAKEPPKPKPLALVVPAKAGVIRAARKNGWEVGDEKAGQAVDGDGDGLPVDQWIDANAKALGKTREKFLSDAVANIRAAGKANGNDFQQSVPDMKTSSDLKGFLDGVYARYPKNNDAYDRIYGMWKVSGAKYDKSWQYPTSLHEYTGKTEAERIWDPQEKSWVDSTAPVMAHVNPKTFPFLVRNDAPLGSVFKATYVDAKKVAHTAYLMVADTGTNRAEMSDAAMSQLHINGNTNSVPDGATVSLQYLGEGDVSKLPTPESLAADGKRLEDAYKAKKAAPAKAPPAKGKGGKKTAQVQGGAYYMATVPNHGVVSGRNQLLVAVAHPDCRHSGDQAVVTGSAGVFVGREQSPLAREGDETADALTIKKGTGDQTVIVA